MSWEEQMDEALEEAREDLGQPPRNDWEKEPGIGTAAVDIAERRGKVKVDPEFAPDLSKLAMKGLMSHEIGHAKYHPKSAKTAIMENHWSKEYENPRTVVNLFDDLVDNTSLIFQSNNNQAEELETLYREISDGQGMVYDVLRKEYERISEIRDGESYDFGSTLEEPEGVEKELLDVLHSFPHGVNIKTSEGVRSVMEDHEFYFHKFASAFDPHLDDMQQSGDRQEPQQGEGQEQQQGEGGGRGDEYGEEQPSDIGGDVGVDSFSEDEIEDALDEIARDEDIDIGEFEDILEDTSEEIGEAGSGDQLNQKMGRAIATYYDSLSRQYNLKIEGSVANRVGTAPNGHKDWKIGDRTDMIDPENSLGKVGMPGVTKTRKMDGYEMHGGQAEGKPDATIILDSSSSMQDPEEQTSYAVLGAFCAANSYLGNGSEVAVANFSNETEITEFTKDQTEVQEALVDYQAGGTNLDVEAIQELEGQKTEDTHSILITDAGIENFDDTVEYLENSHGRNTVLWINSEYDDLPEEYSELEEAPQTSLYHVQDESDIPNVVLGEVR